MNLTIMRAIAGLAVFAMLGAGLPTRAQNFKGPRPNYPKMAPLSQYLMERNAEIALARSAAPASISQNAEVLVLGRRGYETAAKGANGFVCLVERSWTAPLNDPNFWNPKLRGPLCLNPQAARSYLPITIKKTELVLAGDSKTQMADGIKAAFNEKQLPTLERGAMCYMLSPRQYLGDGPGRWHPHLMFFIPATDSVARGENLAGSPVLTSAQPLDRLTILMVLVPKWSDGTADSAGKR